MVIRGGTLLLAALFIVINLCVVVLCAGVNARSEDG